ncbi:MAG TPA: DNA-3-methyladenine glycosylase [Baekduia sp.]|nr:DNA-3-methyladenine glycosylase [Baekduia sp.]
MALAPSFYDRPVLAVAQDLVGCVVEHGGCAGVIVETEAYHHSEPACHAYVGLTARTSVLFGDPGKAYVYRSYGIHALLNAVCEGRGVGAAVLIRALEPVEGIARMHARRGVSRVVELCNGPGKLTQALGIDLELNDTNLFEGPILVHPREDGWQDPRLIVSRRVGITKAVDLPWRFSAAGSRHVSRPWPAGLRDTLAPQSQGATRPTSD